MSTSRSILSWATVALPALVLSCQMPIGTSTIGDPPPASGTGSKSAPAPSSSTAGTPVASSTGAPDESQAAAPSPETLAAVQGVRDRIQPMTNAAQSRIVFVNCGEGSCSARVEAGSLVSMRDLLQGVSGAYQGRISFEVREHFDAYAGHSYHADVVLGTDTTVPVPSDENALMGGAN